MNAFMFCWPLASLFMLIFITSYITIMWNDSSTKHDAFGFYYVMVSLLIYRCFQVSFFTAIMNQGGP